MQQVGAVKASLSLPEGVMLIANSWVAGHSQSWCYKRNIYYMQYNVSGVAQYIIAMAFYYPGQRQSS